MAPQVLEKKIALLFTYRKIVIIFKSVELEHTPSSFPQSKRWSATMQSQKKKKGSSRRIYSCFFTHNGITTPKTTREGQESTTKTSLHLAWPPKFKNQVLFTPRAQSRFLDLGLLLRGCRPKSRSLGHGVFFLCFSLHGWEKSMRERDKKKKNTKLKKKNILKGSN